MSVAMYLLLGVGAGMAILAGWRTFNPSPTKLKQPIRVQEEVEFATVERVEKVEIELGTVRSELRAGFDNLQKDRSRSTGNLHERIEEMETRSEQRNEGLRREIKSDMKGVHDRINDVLAAVSGVSSSVETCQKMHLK